MLIHRWTLRSFCICCVVLFTLGSLLQSRAESSCPKWAGRLVSLQGTVEVRRIGETDWKKVRLEETFCFGDTIRVMEDGRAAVQLQNDALLRLDQKTSLTFSDVQNERTYIIDLLRGAVHFFSRGSKSLKVVTPYVNAAVEGTEFEVRVTDGEAKVTLMEGQVFLENDQGGVTLAKGQVGVAKAGKAPTSYMTVSPRDAVKWALYYPRVVQMPSEDAPALSDGMRLALQAEDKLSLGQVDMAEEDIDAALFLEPENGDAISLKAIIAVVNNRKEEAMLLAEKAVLVAPEAASAQLALSYARQAAFDLEGALAALETAVELEPENALVLARLSELRLSLEDVDGAFLAAQRATALQPDLSHIQSVLGYAYLAQVKLGKAREAFEIAISLDSSAPLPQLGLGLTKIRKGELIEGRRLIEVAAGLDPANSVFRSYLGKAYFEEKRDKFSADQYAVAKELDPRDPTPYFYSAIMKKTQNRPVEALQDINQSVELNDNRAVYRSRFLLDQDLAARSAGQGRIYQELGFEQLALGKGGASLAVDPGNYAAHRFMADMYAALPRHDLARVSELFQSQMLQPMNVVPVQPHLEVGNLYILEGAGPSDQGFSENISLFVQDRIGFQASGVTGANSTLGGEAVASAVAGKVSFSVGKFHYESDGFRENAGHEHDIENAFIQMQIGPKTSALAQWRRSEHETGVLELFYTEPLTPDLQKVEKIDHFRIGARHTFSSSAEVLTWVGYEKGDVSADVYPGFFNVKDNTDHYIGEARVQYRMDPILLIGGLGYRHFVRDQIATYFGFPSSENYETDFANAYIYVYSNLMNDLRLTWGFSAEYLDEKVDEMDHSQLNPKLGLEWSPAASTTFRAALTRTLYKPFISDKDIVPTIEPVQIAGFNQFYFGWTGEDAWRYSLAVDHQFTDHLFGGMEISLGDLKVELLVGGETGPSAIFRDWKERTSRSYLYWVPYGNLALSAEYLYEWYDRPEADGYLGIEEFSELRTHRIPLGARYFFPWGGAAEIKATYIDQKGKFTVPDVAGFVLTPGEDRFWVCDASIRYRLPLGYGTASLEAKNLFDGKFRFQDTDPGNPRFLPERQLFLKVTLAY